MKVAPQQLSFLMLTALVIGNMIGAGIYTLPSAIAPYGGVAVFAWIFTALGALMLALLFANLSRTLVKSGGPYAYCRAALGDFVGFLVAYNYWIAIWIGNAAVSVSLAGYLSTFFAPLNEHTLVYNPWLSFGVKVALVWFMTFINTLGVRRVGEVQVITVFLKVLPLLLIILFGLPLIDWHHLFQLPSSQANHSLFSSLTSAATMTLWAFIGIEAATVPSESAQDVRDVAKATVWGTLITASIYILSTIVVMGLIPTTTLSHLSAPFNDAAALIFGRPFAIMISVSAVVSCLGGLNGWILMQGQIPMAAARDGLFPQWFAKQNKQGAPIYSLCLSSGCVTLLLLLTTRQTLVAQFTFITLLATLAILVPYLLTAIADLILLKKNPEHLTKKRRCQAAIIAVLAGGYAAWAIWGGGLEMIGYGSLLMLTSVPVYGLMQWRKRKL